MKWLEITIKTVSSAIDLLSDKLTAIGYDSFIVDDSNDFQTFLEENKQYWDYVDEDLAQKMKDVSQIRLYVKQDGQALEQIATLENELSDFRKQNSKTDLGSLEITLKSLQEEDWENNWKQYYQPIPIGERLLIVPQWLYSDTLNAPDKRIPVILDPGMIFGTGSHASTQMCLKALEQRISGSEQIIDFGSGSGILSIAALRLGAQSAIGVDIDPKAEDIARKNASLNGIEPSKFTAITGNVIDDPSTMNRLTRQTYDIVLANIVADVIIPLASIVPHCLKKQGFFICSGILNTRLNEVLSALNAAGLYVITQEEENDWCCLTATLK